MDRPIGWTDESCPEGLGYYIMTEEGLKKFDLSERAEYEAEKARVHKYIADMEQVTALGNYRED